MGFSVVAEEVRALAQRSAQAAHETAEKIEDSIQKSGQGVAFSEKVSRSLHEIQEKVRSVDELIAEIANASTEQTRGINQINSAVAQIDRVTQTTAATAEESAGASVQLNTQATNLRTAVAELIAMIEGRAAGFPVEMEPSQPVAPVSRIERTAAPRRTMPSARRETLTRVS